MDSRFYALPLAKDKDPSPSSMYRDDPSAILSMLHKMILPWFLRPNDNKISQMTIKYIQFNSILSEYVCVCVGGGG